MTIKYRSGYKYVLLEADPFQLDIRPSHQIETDYASLDINGILIVKPKYAWDGCSGPTRDDNTNMQGGLVHDVLCQFMREGLLPKSYRKAVNEELKRICIEDGMWEFRANYYKWGVDTRIGINCARHTKEIKFAP